MSADPFARLKEEVARRESRVKAFLFEQKPIAISHPHLSDAVYSYLKAGGKSLRPAVLMFACGAVGGDEEKALPAAASVEVFHTFTLVHDDIIDRDELRRGVPTVHVDFARRAREDFGYDAETAAHYGLALAILAGDIQQAWASSLMTELYTTYGRSPVLALNLINELFRHVQTTLVNGETLDIVLSRTPLDQVTDAQILEMLRQKTGVLYEFAGRAGAAIGLDEPDLKAPLVEAVARFTGRVGVAFQVQDDVLAITGETSKLGKKVGNDVREGKRTLVVTGSLRNMDARQRAFMTETLGSEDASDDQIQEVIRLMKDSGGIDYARSVARKATNEALESLDRLPDSPYRALLHDWADYLINREL